MSTFANNNINSLTKMKGFFKFGRQVTDVIKFNTDTDMVDVHLYLLKWFNNVLPSKFHIEFYSCEAQKLFVLNEDLLETENNPFRCSSIDSNQEMTNIMDCVQFFIVNDSSPDDQTNSQSNSLLDTLSADDLDEALVNSTVLDEVAEALLFSPLVPNSSNEVISHNNDATNDEDTNNNITDDNSVAVNDSLDSQNNSQHSTDCQLATETTDENDIQSSRITFSHDVHPKQKHHYLTNKYKINARSSKTGGISYMQGLKTEKEIEGKIQVLPHLSIPLVFRLMRQWILLLFAVYEEEEEENGTRIWYKNHDKGFLQHDQLKPNAEFLNPIRLTLNNSQLKENGDYPLEIYLLTKRDKTSQEKVKIYQLSKTAVDRIHKAKHVKCSKRKPLKPTRILCVPEIDNQPFWPSCGLSNFIQPAPNNPKPPTFSESTSVSTANINVNSDDLLNLIPVYRINVPSVTFNAITTVRVVSPPPKRQKTKANANS